MYGGRNIWEKNDIIQCFLVLWHSIRVSDELAGLTENYGTMELWNYGIIGIKRIFWLQHFDSESQSIKVLGYAFTIYVLMFLCFYVFFLCSHFYVHIFMSSTKFETCIVWKGFKWPWMAFFIFLEKIWNKE